MSYVSNLPLPFTHAARKQIVWLRLFTEYFLFVECNSGKADHYVEVQLRKDEVEKCPTRDGRDVYRVPDKDVELDEDKKPRIGKTGDAAKKK